VSELGALANRGSCCISANDASGALVSGGFADQQVLPQQYNRAMLLVFNLSTTEQLWINFTLPAGEAGAPGLGALPLDPLREWKMIFPSPVFNDSVHLAGASVGHPFVVKYG
jgi:hypothetical protein